MATKDGSNATMFKENRICKLIGHKYINDNIIIRPYGNRYKISRRRYCKRCKVTVIDNYGLYKKIQLDNHYVSFDGINDRVYEEYQKIVGGLNE